MASITEGMYTGEFLLSEAPGTLSRDVGTVAVPASTTLAAGAVLVQGNEEIWDPVTTEAVVDGAVLGILYAEQENDTEAGVEVDAVVVTRNAEVRGDDLDWAEASNAAIASGVDLLALQHLIVRDYVLPS